MNTTTLRRTAIALGLAGLFAAGYAFHGHGPFADAQAVSTAATAPIEAGSGATITLPDFTTIVAREGPAVVNIGTSGTMHTAMPGMPDDDPNNPFNEFFRRFHVPIPQGKMPTHGLGSGFIVSSDGVILTNAHVVADADEVTVKLTDKREFKAKIVGMDKTSDVAVLRISASDLPTVKIGDPQKARVGEWVLAIGSPFGFENSVTAGIISAKSRTLPDEGYVPFMQTDVAVNPGNSGGPLINAAGEVIGINSQIYSRSGGYQGLSFAIPIDVAMKVESQLLQHGKVSRGRLGVLIQEMNQGLAESFGLKKAEGALVASVEEGSPAAKAGIEPGDVILQFNGKDIEHSNDLPPLVADLSPGSPAKLTVWRQGAKREISLTVGEMQAAKADEAPAVFHGGRLGLSVRPLTAEEKSQVGSGGLVVEDVGVGPAAKAGIEPDDVILAVNGQKVTSVEQLRNLVAKAGKRAALLILREDKKIYVPINLG
ncbi:MAG TPA: DegQ family serine endoprotease [Rhodocyclaceae bacterium]|nr:DegQ family serine endoprotease [Rhodocyclaceae bacterium]